MKKRIFGMFAAVALVMSAIGFTACNLSIEKELIDTTWKGSIDMLPELGVPKSAAKEMGIDKFEMVMEIEFKANNKGNLTQGTEIKYNSNATDDIKEALKDYDFKETVPMTWTVDESASTVTVTVTIEGNKISEVFDYDGEKLTAEDENSGESITLTKK